MAKLKFGPVEGGIQLGAGENGGDVNNPDSGNLGGRGGAEDNGITDPATVTTSGASGGTKERKKRGPNRGKAENKQMDVATLKNSLVFMHIIAAGVFGSPELALNTEQADLYASAVADVMKHYDTSVPAKTLAWMNLAAAAGGIYYQKVVEIGSRPPRNASVVGPATVTRSQMGA